MQIKETIGVSFPGSVESPPLAGSLSFSGVGDFVCKQGSTSACWAKRCVWSGTRSLATRVFAKK